MTTLNDTATALSADDIAALRKADSVTFHYYLGEGVIRAHLRGGYVDDPRIFTAREQRLYPNTDTGRDRMREISVYTSMRGYHTDNTTGWYLSADNSNTPAAFHMEHSALYDAVWQTIAGLLKVGDSIQLLWVADNNTGSIVKAGLHADSLSLAVQRDGQARYTFDVAHSITPDNSARMVQRNGA